MKKLSIILTLALVVALAAPAFADNVEITGEVTTTFELSDYGDTPDAAVNLWKDGDLVDEDPTTDPDEFPARKAFWQEIDFSIAGNVNDTTTFNLDVDTVKNVFTDTHAAGNGVVYGTANGSDAFVMDSALLTLDNAAYTLKAGDFADYGVTDYFVDEEDLEGVEVTTAVRGHDVKAFVLGDNGATNFGTQDFYGVSVARGLGNVDLTGKFLQSRAADKVTNLSLAADAVLTEAVSANVEYVANSAENADTSDSLVRLGGTVAVNDALTVNANALTVGKDFEQVAGDINDEDYTEYAVGADYTVDANTTVGGSYTVEDYADVATDDDVNTLELTLNKVMGDLTTDVTFENEVVNDANDTTTTLLVVDNEYALNDATTLTAGLTNKSVDNGVEYTALKGGVAHKLADNVDWNTEAQLVTGTDAGGTDADATTLNTELVVSF